MVSDITLSKDTYETLKRVPATWWDESEVVLEVGVALRQNKTAVTRRLARLVQLGLVERRRRPTIDAATEIRRVGK